MADDFKRQPPPGAITPEKYTSQGLPAPGPKYMHYGEQAGWIYNPYKDSYEPDPAVAKPWAENAGLIDKPPEKPGFMEQAGPALASMAVYKGGEALMEGGVDKIAGMMGGGSSSAPAAGAGASQGAAAAQGAAASQGSGAGMMAGTGSVQGPLTETGQMLESAGMGRDTAMSVGDTVGGYGYAEGGPINYLGPVSMAAGGMGMYDAYQSGDELGGALSGAAFGSGVMGTAALMGFNPALWGTFLGLGPLGWLAAGGALLGTALGAFGGHKSTKQYQAERRGALFDENPRLAGVEVLQMNPDDDGIWDSGRYEGQQWTFEKASDLVLNPESDMDKNAFIGNLGNFETWGEEWVHVPIEQQQEITRRLTEEGLYSSDKGDIIIGDKNKARANEIYNEVVNGEQNQQEEQQDGA